MATHLFFWGGIPMEADSSYLTRRPTFPAQAVEGVGGSLRGDRESPPGAETKNREAGREFPFEPENRSGRAT